MGKANDYKTNFQFSTFNFTTMTEIPDLNYREIQTLILTCKEIAQRLSLSKKTVEHYRSSLLHKKVLTTA
ncbi:MAG: LuxR C-terminal-related transcriptional regulator [Bacteroidota bacterium]|nr:LuxR C-terminal-related transcriptional regulator [Bacteroidota bacterium]